MNVRKIAIFGAGGFGKEVAATIELANRKELLWNLVGFYDDGVERGSQVSHYGEVLGGIDELNDVNFPLCLAIAIGSPHSRRYVRERITNSFVSFPNIINEPFACPDPQTLKMGMGNIIQGGCYASCDVTIGDFNVLNGSVKIGHDVTIGDNNVIMPAVRISGEVKIGNNNLLGVSSIVLQQLKIGDNVCLGAGAVLMTKPKNGGTYLGNPAKLFKF